MTHLESLYVHNKHRWVGPDVEWHQEVFNIKTFHPTNINYSIDEVKNNFMQIYVALEDQNLVNGCLKIIPYQDILDDIITLEKPSDEKTVVRFKVDEKGNVTYKNKLRKNLAGKVFAETGLYHSEHVPEFNYLPTGEK